MCSLVSDGGRGGGSKEWLGGLVGGELNNYKALLGGDEALPYG